MLCRLGFKTGISLQSVKVFSQRFINAQATIHKEKWDLYAGVLVERLPVVSKTLTPLEKDFQELLWKMEYENSLKSDFELQHEREQQQAERIKKGEIEVDLEDTASKQTAQDLKDAYTEELKKFKIAPRITNDDKLNKLTSTNRCLEDTLYLLVEHKLGNQNMFLLPQGPRLDGETMRQTAERIIREKCGNKMQVNFYGNAPVGFYKYKYPVSVRSESIGAKVFFFRGILQQGNVDETIAQKYEWLTKPLLEEKLQNGNYRQSITKFML